MQGEAEMKKYGYKKPDYPHCVASYKTVLLTDDVEEATDFYWQTLNSDTNLEQVIAMVFQKGLEVLRVEKRAIELERKLREEVSED